MKIRITENGPYIADADIPISEAISLAYDGGVTDYKIIKSYDETDSDKYICRCGHSGKKPFCDGAHVKSGFDGTENDNRMLYDDEAEYLKGLYFDAMDNQKLCAVARFCDQGEGFWYAFDHMDEPENKKYVEEVGCKCAAGRLTLVDKNTGEKIEPKLEKEIYVIKDAPADHLGPIYVKGGIQVIGVDGFKYEIRNRVTLCRCGESSIKPFCDGTHLECRHMEI